MHKKFSDITATVVLTGFRHMSETETRLSIKWSGFRVETQPPDAAVINQTTVLQFGSPKHSNQSDYSSTVPEQHLYNYLDYSSTVPVTTATLNNYGMGLQFLP